MRSLILSSLFLLLAFAAWGGYGYLVWELHNERAAIAKELAATDAQSVREENATRLRATVQGTEVERAALESIVSVTALDAVETIELAAKQAGATDVKIGEASQVSTSQKGLSAFSVVLNATGSFVSLARTASLLETLPLPATVEQFEITKTDKNWRLTARLRITLAAVQ